jgi:hypothetical protein
MRACACASDSAHSSGLIRFLFIVLLPEYAEYRACVRINVCQSSDDVQDLVSLDWQLRDGIASASEHTRMLLAARTRRKTAKAAGSDQAADAAAGTGHQPL